MNREQALNIEIDHEGKKAPRVLITENAESTKTVKANRKCAWAIINVLPVTAALGLFCLSCPVSAQYVP